MHMADALVSPAVGGTMWAISGSLIVYCSRKIGQNRNTAHLVPMMGVLGAFVFAAQMINFTVPVTGSSGHLGGGLLLSILLGPYAAFLVMASVLTVQALFFADGGLLSLGCNIFNLGFLPAFVAFPLLYRLGAQRLFDSKRTWFGTIVVAVVALQLGALSVVLETTASGISDLPLGLFLLLMQPIHLAIGIAEGLATAAVVAFIAKSRPEALKAAAETSGYSGLRSMLLKLAVVAVLVAGVASWFASTRPDGLEWSIAKAAGKEELDEPDTRAHKKLASVQKKTAFLPDYGFKPADAQEPHADPSSQESWPNVSAETFFAGLIGGALVLTLAVALGIVLRGKRRLGKS